MRRHLTECFQFIEEDDGGWLVVEQLHNSGGGSPMAWRFATRERAELHLREARDAHRAAYGCGRRPPIRRPDDGEVVPKLT